MSRSKAMLTGFWAGLIAALSMTIVMLLLATIGVATPLTIMGDRISVFLPPGPFLALMGKVGGYNHLKQLGVGSTIAGQLLVGAAAGSVLGLFFRRDDKGPRIALTFSIFVLLPLVTVAVALWPVLRTSYNGFPISVARLITLIGFTLCVLTYERVLVIAQRFLTRRTADSQIEEFSPHIQRRTLVLGGLGLLLTGGGIALVRKLYRTASFKYDGTEYKGRIVEPITPNHRFYCVTKNVIDPHVDVEVWRLEVNGLVRDFYDYQLKELQSFKPVEQETTLMCISNGLDGGLMSNAVWKGVAMADLLSRSKPLADAKKVRLYGVDNYTDTFPIEKALNPTTIVAFEMNGRPLPNRHGYPARVIVPGYFGEKHVKWLTRIEVTGADAKGFYEAQGWGPDFIVPTRSRIDVPEQSASFSLGKLDGRIEVRGVAFGGDRGISRVELSFDNGNTWSDADIYYSGGRLAWSLWRAQGGWSPEHPGDYTIVVRATDGKGAVQRLEEERSFFSGITGFHTIGVHVAA